MCEGPDECHVVKHMTDKAKLNLTWGCKEHGLSLVEEFRGLAVDVKLKRLRCVGFLFDAGDDDREFREAYEQFFKTLEVAAPKNPQALSRLSIGGEGFATITYLSPVCLEALFDPQMSGEIRECIESFIDCHKVPASTQAKVHKQRLRAYLAAKNFYNTQLGVALDDGHLTCDKPEFAPMLEFLKTIATA